ncbi:hypothetical protein ACFQHO_13875 [Actinomadura yumaensis]|uniref:hypothetical protein n=1 Tax=Actinomadura yumaensis TaxID=111807 RepID=UPI003623DF57
MEGGFADAAAGSWSRAGFSPAGEVRFQPKAGAGLCPGGLGRGGPSSEPERRHRRSAPSGAGAAAPECREIREPGVNPEEDFNQHPRLQEVYKTPPLPAGNFETITSARSLAYCIRASGFANVKKLGGATPIGAETLLRRAVKTVRAVPAGSVNYNQQQGYFDTQAMPATTTMLGFGFMPTTATAEVAQVRPPGTDPAGKPYLTTGNLRSDLAVQNNLPSPRDDETWGRSYVAMRATKALVNGTALPLGASCGTAPTPLEINSFTGNIETGRLRLEQGSTFTGKVTIPDFTGCGVGEDLSPLLTATISGPGNALQLETGQWCRKTATSNCDTEREPKTITVSPGGKVTLASKDFIVPGGTGTPLSSVTTGGCRSS